MHKWLECKLGSEPWGGIFTSSVMRLWRENRFRKAKKFAFSLLQHPPLSKSQAQGPRRITPASGGARKSALGGHCGWHGVGWGGLGMADTWPRWKEGGNVGSVSGWASGMLGSGEQSGRVVRGETREAGGAQGLKGARAMPQSVGSKPQVLGYRPGTMASAQNSLWRHRNIWMRKAICMHFGGKNIYVICI